MLKLLILSGMLLALTGCAKTIHEAQFTPPLPINPG
jgi:hypothetical protein